MKRIYISQVKIRIEKMGFCTVWKGLCSSSLSRPTPGRIDPGGQDTPPPLPKTTPQKWMNLVHLIT